MAINDTVLSLKDTANRLDRSMMMFFIEKSEDTISGSLGRT